MVWNPDIRTFLMLGTVLTVLINVLLLVVWRDLPPGVKPSLRWWFAATLQYPLAFLLLGLRGHLPDFISVVVANVLAAGAMSCNAIAIRRFYDVPDRIVRLIVTTALIAIASAWFVYLDPSLHWRIVSVSGLMAVLIGSSARGILRRGGPRGRIPLATAAVFVAGTVLIVFRAVGEMAAPLANDSFLQLPATQSWSFALLGLLPVLGTMGFLLMCTERAQKEFERAARLDYLTEIYNRRAIDELATSAIATAHMHVKPLAVMAIDVDHFKRINDRWGHAVGDDALLETVRRIREGLRLEDMMGRHGGEEFIVVMPDTDAEGAAAVAERVRWAFAETPMLLGEDQADVTVSIGVALLQPDDQAFSSLLRRADLAMYAAKNNGRNQVVVDPGSLLLAVG
jgi:diguanylate cyclase (GGDEF)-like protein